MLGSSGRYLETSIKLASNIQLHKDEVDYDVTNDIEDLLICLISHMRSVQEEHCMLLVGGNYGPRTQQIFRAIHNNPGQYTPTIVEELCTSAALAALPQENTSRVNEGRDYRGYRGDFRGNGRFNSFNSFRGRGFHNSGGFNTWSSDNTPGFRSRQVPNERQTED